MRRLDHIKKLSDEGGQGWLVDVRCKCGRSGWLEPSAVARAAGWDATLEWLQKRMRCSRCGQKDLSVTAVLAPKPRGIPKNPH